MRGVLFFSLVLLLTGCIAHLPPPNPSQLLTVGAPLLNDTFDARGAWSAYDAEGLKSDVVDGSYHIETSLRQYALVLHGETWTDVIVEAELYLRSGGDAVYGVLCRAQSEGTGYYFLLSHDGAFSIRRGEWHATEALVPWQNTSAINQQSPRQRVRAVCKGEYLALYINDQFVGETTDHLYSRGHVGLTAAVPPGAAAGAQIELDIDSVRVWKAE
jgi:hypothetical protein